MKFVLSGMAAAALLTLTSATCFAQQNTQPASPGAHAVQEPAVMVTLATTQKKGPTGQAILSQQGNDVMVTLKMEPTNQSSDAAIVRGTCPEEPAATQPAGMSNQANNNSTSGSSTSGSTAAQNTMSLSAVTNGLSQTTVPGMTVRQLTTGGYAIIVRQKPWLCGDLSKANPVPGTQ